MSRRPIHAGMFSLSYRQFAVRLNNWQLGWSAGPLLCSYALDSQDFRFMFGMSHHRSCRPHILQQEAPCLPFDQRLHRGIGSRSLCDERSVSCHGVRNSLRLQLRCRMHGSNFLSRATNTIANAMSSVTASESVAYPQMRPSFVRSFVRSSFPLNTEPPTIPLVHLPPSRTASLTPTPPPFHPRAARPVIAAAPINRAFYCATGSCQRAGFSRATLLQIEAWVSNTLGIDVPRGDWGGGVQE